MNPLRGLGPAGRNFALSLLSQPQAATSVRFGARHWGWPSRWTVVACLLAALIAAPVVAVVVNALRPRGEIWQHLVETVLGDYIANSFLIMSGVAVGVLIVGVPAAWMTTLCRFPGRRCSAGRCCCRWRSRPT